MYLELCPSTLCPGPLVIVHFEVTKAEDWIICSNTALTHPPIFPTGVDTGWDSAVQLTRRPLSSQSCATQSTGQWHFSTSPNGRPSSQQNARHQNKIYVLSRGLLFKCSSEAGMTHSADRWLRTVLYHHSGLWKWCELPTQQAKLCKFRSNTELSLLTECKSC